MISQASARLCARKKIQVKVTKVKTSSCLTSRGNPLLVELRLLQLAGQAAAQRRAGRPR